jgi:hypothetical protein
MLGWARVWYNKKTGVVEIQEIQSDLFQKGRGKERLDKQEPAHNFAEYKIRRTSSGRFEINNYKYDGEIDVMGDYATLEEAEFAKQNYEKNNLIEETKANDKGNQFLQLLNKDDNWVTFFIKSIIQTTAKQTVTEVQQEDIEAKVRELEKEGLLEIDCKGKLKAEKGLVTSFTKGGKWKIIKDLKGYPIHKEGGVDLTIGKNGVSIKNGNIQFTAKHGLVIPKN